MAKWSVQFNPAGDGKHWEHHGTVEANDEEGAYAAAKVHPTKRKFFAVAPLNEQGNVTMNIAGHAKSEKEVSPMKKHDSAAMNVVQDRLGLTYEETIDLDNALRNGSIPQLRKFSAIEDLGGETSENLKKMAPNIKKWTSLLASKQTPTEVLNDPKVKAKGAVHRGGLEREMKTGTFFPAGPQEGGATLDLTGHKFLGRSEIKSQVIEMINGQIATLVELQKREVALTDKCPLCEQTELDCSCIRPMHKSIHPVWGCLLCNQPPTMCQCISKLEKSGPVPIDGCAKCGKKTPELRGTWGMTCNACSTRGSDEKQDESSPKPTQKPASLRNSEESPEESSSGGKESPEPRDAKDDEGLDDPQQVEKASCDTCKSEICKCMEKNTPKNPTRQTQQKKDKLDDAARMKKLGASKGQYKEAVKTGFIHDPKVASKKSEDFINNKTANQPAKSTDEAFGTPPRLKNVGAENDNPSEVPGKKVGGDEGSGGEVKKGKGSEKKLDKAAGAPAPKPPPTAKPPTAAGPKIGAAPAAIKPIKPAAPAASPALKGKITAGAPPAMKSELSLSSPDSEWMEELSKASGGFGRSMVPRGNASAAAGRFGSAAGLKPAAPNFATAATSVAKPAPSVHDQAVTTSIANKRVIPGAAGKVPGTVDANMQGFKNVTGAPSAAPMSGLAGLMARYKTRIAGS